MRILIACEKSGIIRDAFLNKGHDAVSCDIMPTENPGPHYQCDVLDILNKKWDLIIGNPECKYLAFSGEQWRTPNHKNYKAGHFQLRLKALGFFIKLMNANCERICMENSHSEFINKYYRISDQKIQPYQFGEPFVKQTHLWLKNLPPLMYTQIIPKEKRKQDCWLQHPSENRSSIRAKTYIGIAQAMANQWG